MKLKRVRVKTWTILAICDERGSCEFYDWLKKLPEKLLDRVNAFLDCVSTKGPPRWAEVSHQIDKDIWQWTPHPDVRIAWFYDKGHLIIISHGFGKHRQKTTDADKTKARTRFNSYFEAKRLGKLEILKKGCDGTEESK